MTVKINPTQLTTLLAHNITNRLATLVVGSPGIGKSDIVESACDQIGADLLISHPAMEDPTDAKGLPWPGKDGTHASFLPFGHLAKAAEAKRLTVWFLDDLGQASPAVQAAYMQLILSHKAGEHELSKDKVVFVAATNRRTDKAGVNGILEPVKSRFASIVELQPELEDWVQWAYGQEMPAELIAFIRSRPDLLNDFLPTADMEQSPCPRTWAYVGRQVKAGVPRAVELAAIAGAVGEGAATEFVSYLRLSQEMPDPDAVIADPLGMELPENPSVLYALCAALAYRASKDTSKPICQFAERLHSDGHGEFGALLIKDAYRRDKQVANTVHFNKLADGRMGGLLAGDYEK